MSRTCTCSYVAVGWIIPRNWVRSMICSPVTRYISFGIWDAAFGIAVCNKKLWQRNLGQNHIIINTGFSHAADHQQRIPYRFRK